MNENIFDESAFQNLSKEKLEFLKNFQNPGAFQNTSDMASALMRAMQTSKDSNLDFTPDETFLLFQLLKSKLPPAEQGKADMIYRMAKNRPQN